MSRVRTAVVGLNKGISHAYAYEHSNAAELRWVVDMDVAKAVETAELLGCKYTTDWKEILDDVDAISFATPHHLHYPMAIEAIEAGKHILMEKPLANSEEECRKLISAAEAKGVTLMVAFDYRFNPLVKRLKEELEKGAYGEPINASVWIEDYVPPMPGTWFSRKDMLGGGVLFSHGCHQIDVLQYLLGKPIEVAGLGTRKGTEWMEGEGTHHAIISFESGALAHLVSSWGMKHKRPPANMHLHTTRACFVMHRDKLEVIDENGITTLHEETISTSPKTVAIPQVEHFLACVQNGQRPVIDGHESMKSLQIIWALYDHKGTPVYYDEKIKMS